MGFIKRKSLWIILLLVLVAAVTIFILVHKPAGVADDILSQKKTPEGKTQITVLVKYAFSINGFEAAVEKKFPNIDIVQVGNYTRDIGVEDYAQRLEHDDLTDIVMTWPLEVGEQFWDDRLLDLSGFAFTGNYNLSMLDNISRDGKLYYLPGPSQIRGIVYNKTLFEENGWKVPVDFEGFVELCKTIETGGIRALQLGFKNSEVLDTAFIGYSLSDCLSKPKDIQWLDEYNNGEHSFGDHFSPALDTFRTLIDEGVIRESDLDVDYAKRENLLFTRQCAMVEDSVLMARMGLDQTGITDEFALMPFFTPGGEDWARLYMVCYVGLNKHLIEPKNKEKYELVLELMDYISTQEGQEALMSDTGAMFSSVTGVGATSVPEIQDLINALDNGRFAVFPQLKNAQEALRNGLAGMLRGNTTKAEVIKMVDGQNASPPAKIMPTVIGSSTSDFTLLETGNFVTDAMREKSGAEIALFLDNGKDGRYNGKGISGKLYEGDVTVSDIERILPDLKQNETGTLWTVEITGENLIKTLEYAIPVYNDQTGWFYYFSGLRMKYDPTAAPGSRIRNITDEDGNKIDLQKIYTVAVMDQTVPEEFFISVDRSGITIRDILIAMIRDRQDISPSLDGRFTVAGS